MPRGKRKIKLALSILFIIVMFSIAGCNSTKLADCYDEKEVEDTAIDVINDVQVRGARVVLEERMREDFIGNIDLDEMDGSCKSYVSSIGGFLGYTKKTVIGRHYDETDEDFAVALITAAYEDGEVNYTITFDKDMKIAGFYPQD